MFVVTRVIRDDFGHVVEETVENIAPGSNGDAVFAVTVADLLETDPYVEHDAEMI